jgi:hypothetical protein
VRQASDEGFSRAVVIKALVPGNPAFWEVNCRPSGLKRRRIEMKKALSVSPNEG